MSKFLNYFFLSINKKLSIGYKSMAGRNYSGVICVHHKEVGSKNNYIHIDFYRRLNIFGFVYKIIKCQYRTGFLGGIIYENGLFSYILLTEKLTIGSKFYTGSFNKNLELNTLGTTIILKNIRLFSIINNIEVYPYSGGSLTRSAGCRAILTGKVNDKVILKLKSGWNIWLSQYCISTIGNVSNMKHKFDNLKKAGNSRALGIRPTVRGVAMNPCDHPHGGGEGKKSPPSGQVSPWGWLTKGTPSLQKKIHKKKKKLYKSL